MGTHRLTSEDLEKFAWQYRQVIDYLQEGKSLQSLKNCVFQTDIPELSNLSKS
jgi:hypothetical protein